MANTDGQYNETPPTLGDHQWGSLQLDSNGYLRVVSDSAPYDDVQGSTTDAKVTDPDADASVISLLKGILQALNTIAVNTATP